MGPAKIAMLPQNGTALQRNFHVRKIYTALEPAGDDRWEVVTVIETGLALGDPEMAPHSEQLVQDIEADARAGLLVGRVIVKGL